MVRAAVVDMIYVPFNRQTGDNKFHKEGKKLVDLSNEMNTKS
jgi:hypothetical protein